MPDERTYGFNKDDAQSLVQGISHAQGWYPEIRPRRGGGFGTHEIFFQIETVTCNDDGSKTLYVTALWYDGGCTKSIPGEDEYGGIEVIDPCGELEFYTADWLGTGGRTGWAKYMYPRGAEYCEPQWLVKSICGVPECS